MGKRTLKAEKYDIDSILLLSVVALIIMGVIMVFSSSAIIAQKNYHNMYFFVLRQLIWVFIGGAALFAGYKVKYRTWAKASPFILLFVLLLLLAVLVPFIGHTVGGARRWIRLGGVGFQPSEMAKVAVIIYLSSVLDRKFSKIETFSKDLIPPLGFILLITLLIYKQPDFGTAALIAVLTVTMLFLGGLKLKYLGIGFFVLVPPMIYALLAHGYRKERLLSFLDPFENIYGSGFQLAHSIMALGDGGLSGVGLGAGYHKLFFIPEVHTDFVFSMIGQELGFIGTLSILLLFLIFMWRGLRISLKHNDYLAQVMSAGLTILIAFQAMVNIGVVTGCLPTKGLSLPFVSFGGSSLFFNMFAVGILLNISESVKKRSAPIK